MYEEFLVFHLIPFLLPSIHPLSLSPPRSCRAICICIYMYVFFLLSTHSHLLNSANQSEWRHVSAISRRERKERGGERGGIGWSLRPTAVSAPRVTSLVRVRYVRPVSIIHTHDIFTALKVVQRSISTPTHVRRRRFSYALGPRTFPPLISNRSRTVPPPRYFFSAPPYTIFLG